MYVTSINPIFVWLFQLTDCLKIVQNSFTYGNACVRGNDAGETVARAVNTTDNVISLSLLALGNDQFETQTVRCEMVQ